MLRTYQNNYKTFIIFILTFSLFISGCIDSKNNENNNTADTAIFSNNAKSISLNISNLENGYQMIEPNDTLQAINGIEIIDYYHSDFNYIDPMNDSGFPWIGQSIYITKSSSNAKSLLDFLYNKKNQTISNSKDITLSQSNEVGNESKLGSYLNKDGDFYRTDNVTFAFIYFRSYNVVVYIFAEGIPPLGSHYHGLITNKAKIIENNIKNSMIQ